MPTAGTHDQAVSVVDVAPTVLELLGFDVRQGLDGRSLVPLFDGQSLPQRPIVTDVVHGGEHLHRGVISEPWKLIANHTSGMLELDHLLDDPENVAISWNGSEKCRSRHAHCWDSPTRSQSSSLHIWLRRVFGAASGERRGSRP